MHLRIEGGEQRWDGEHGLMRRATVEGIPQKEVARLCERSEVSILAKFQRVLVPSRLRSVPVLCCIIRTNVAARRAEGRRSLPAGAFVSERPIYQPTPH